MGSTPKISVIIPTYNRADVLAECLQLLSCQSSGSDCFEVLVCDDGSTDGTQELLETFSPPYKLTSIQQANAGPSAARNSAIRSARAPLVLILNDDTFPASNVVELHLRRQLENTNGNVSILGTCNINPRRINDYFTNLVDRMHLILCHHSLGDDLTGTSFNHFFTCNISVARQALLDVGLFDESFFKGCEDVELGYRLQKEGWGVLYDPSIQSSHHHLQTPESFADMITTRAMGYILIWNKHPEIDDIEIGSSTLNGAIFERALRYGKDSVLGQLQKLIDADIKRIHHLLDTIRTRSLDNDESDLKVENSIKARVRSLHLYSSFCGRLQSPVFSKVANAANPQILRKFPTRTLSAAFDEVKSC